MSLVVQCTNAGMKNGGISKSMTFYSVLIASLVTAVPSLHKSKTLKARMANIFSGVPIFQMPSNAIELSARNANPAWRKM
jgi:hypothetical protein